MVIVPFPEEVLQLRNAKAPIDFVFSEPLVPVKTPTVVSIWPERRIPTQRRCSSIFCFQAGARYHGRSRPLGEPQRLGYLVDLKGKKMQIPSVEWDEKQVELIKLYNSIFALN